MILPWARWRCTSGEWFWEFGKERKRRAFGRLFVDRWPLSTSTDVFFHAGRRGPLIPRHCDDALSSTSLRCVLTFSRLLCICLPTKELRESAKTEAPHVKRRRRRQRQRRAAAALSLVRSLNLLNLDLHTHKKKPTSCVTCGLPGAACAGHFGHIELAVPVYNPLVFG